MKDGLEVDRVDFFRLIEGQANLSAAALASSHKRLSEKVYTLLSHEWAIIENIEEKYIEVLKDLEPGNGVIVLASLLMKFLVHKKETDLVDKLKVSWYK